MSDVCTSRPTTTRHLAGTEPELIAASALDLAGCDRLEIVVGLYEHERAGLRFETWPPKLQNDIATLIAQWIERNPTRVLRAQTCAVQERACVMIVHHAAKG
jgi:hypothetical protein